MRGLVCSTIPGPVTWYLLPDWVRFVVRLDDCCTSYSRHYKLSRAPQDFLLCMAAVSCQANPHDWIRVD